MLREGWEWSIVPADVDIQFPAFAKIAQQALNISNHIAACMSEMEVAMSIAELVEDGREASVMDHVTDLGVPCACYVDQIKAFVMDYGGGSGSPQISFVDSVAKMFNCNVVLGKQVWSNLTELNFFDQESKYPLLRVALLLVKMVCPKATIDKSEFTQLAAKKNVTLANQCERTLRDMETVKAYVVQTQGKRDDDLQLLEAKGQAWVRIGLFAVSRGHQGLEGTKYTMDEIKSLYLQAMTDAVGKTIGYSGWDVQAQVAQPISKKQLPALTTMDDHNNPVWIAKAQGYVPGVLIKLKDTEVVWTINEISEAGMFTLSQAINYSDDKSTKDVALKDILHSWVQEKNKRYCIPLNTRL